MQGVKIKNIIVPPGIGDFSWIWSKLCTTGDAYNINIAKVGPDRLPAFLVLLPREKIAGIKINSLFSCGFIEEKLEMRLINNSDGRGNPLPRMEKYSDMPGTETLKFDTDFPSIFVEANSHLEHGKPLSLWLPDLPTEYHYKINGTLDNPPRVNMFIVHLSSFRMQKIWKTYSVDDYIRIIEAVQKMTGWLPLFIGTWYDDMAQACFEKYIENRQAASLIGKTEDLVALLCLIQQSKLFLGCVSSGLTVLANVLYTPSISWWPRMALANAWPDHTVFYKALPWDVLDKDISTIERGVRKLL